MTAIASFMTGAPNYTILDTSDPTGHTAWGFPGMQFKVHVGSLAGTTLKSVTCTFSTGLLYLDIYNQNPVNTVYTPDLGYASTISTQTDSHAGTTDTTDTPTWSLPKDAVNITINVSMVPWVYTPSGYVAGAPVTDALLIRSEPVTVSPFTITGAPMWAGLTSGFAPNPTGTDYALQMIGIPPSPDQASFTATVTNSTHYDLQIGFIQTIISVQSSNTFTDGSYQSVAGSSLLDSTQTDLVWYSPNSYGRVNAGGNATITGSDSPGTYESLVKTAGPPVVGLTSLTLSGQFQSNVVVYGGWNGWQSNAPAVPGVPIALSTAAWHVYGKATAPFTAPPTLGAGSGPMPATLPGPNGVWTSTGDGVAKYLSWNGNAKALLNSGGISGVVFATASEEAGVSVSRVAWARAFDEAARSGRRIAGPDGSRSRSLALRPAPFFLGSRSSIPPVVNAAPRNLPAVASLRPRRVHALNADVLPSGGE